MITIHQNYASFEGYFNGAIPVSSTAIGLSTFVFLLFFCWILKRKRYIDTINAIPGPPIQGSHPILCHAHDIEKTTGSIPNHPNKENFLSVLKMYVDKYGRNDGIFKFWLLNPFLIPFASPIIFVTNPAMIKQLLNDKSVSSHVAKEKRFSNITKPILGDSIFLAPGNSPKWKQHRKLVAKGFSQSFLEHTHDVAIDLLYNQLFPRWENKKQNIEALEWMNRLTTEILGLVAFGQTFGGLQHQDIDDSLISISSPLKPIEELTLYDMTQEIMNIAANRLRYPPLVSYFKIKENARCNKLIDHLNQFISKIIQDRQELQKQQEKTKLNKHKDILSFLMSQQESTNTCGTGPSKGGTKNNQSMSMNEIFGNVRALLYAGQETTASTMAGGLWLLATDLKVQQVLHEELKPYFEAESSQRHYKQLMQLPYLDAVVREILRIYPSGGTPRTNSKDIKLKNDSGSTYKIPKGSEILILSYVVHYQAQTNKEEFERFDPTRFMDNDSNNKKLDMASYMPFSIGPRNCVGQPMAINELKTIIAHIVHRYILCPSKDAIEPISITTVTTRPHEVMIDLELRA